MARVRNHLQELEDKLDFVQPLADEIDRRTAEFTRRSLARSRYLQEVIGERRGQVKEVFEKMFQTGEGARTIVSREGLTQVADAGGLGAVVDAVLAQHAKVVEDYKAGKKAALGFLVGQVMKATAGKASPAVVNSLLLEKLPKL